MVLQMVWMWVGKWVFYLEIRMGIQLGNQMEQRLGLMMETKRVREMDDMLETQMEKQME